ncbi:MAG: nitroreductase family protein [Clostridia bacterium]|nr:nitroreductase family protein [Clostridia bacterium]
MNEIFHRVSIRKYQQRPVEAEKIMQILKAGMQAPSTGDQQPWEFYVVTNPEKILALSKCQQYAGCAAGAPVLIVPVIRKKGLWLPEYAQIDLAICQENMWLETDSLGLGGVWLGICPQRERMDAVSQILNLPDDVDAFSIFALGYPAEERTQENRFDESRIHFIR